MYRSQLDYDLAAHDDFRDPFEREDLVKEYCKVHGITVEQFIKEVTEAQFWSWVEKNSEEFNL